MNNKHRIGNITSSQIHKVVQTSSRDKTSALTDLKWAAPALTYFEEKRIEKKLGKCLDLEGSSKATAWGNFMEYVIFNLLGIEYKILSKETTVHPKIKYWAGSCDLLIPFKLVGEIKCYQLKKFCQYTDVINLKAPEAEKIAILKKDFAQEYWQMVSNAIIQNVPMAEAITYAPYESEMDGIRELAENLDSSEQWRYRFIIEDGNEKLPVIPDGNPYYSNINKFRFTVPIDDINLLTERVKRAKPELVIK